MILEFDTEDSEARLYPGVRALQPVCNYYPTELLFNYIKKYDVQNCIYDDTLNISLGFTSLKYDVTL